MTAKIKCDYGILYTTPHTVKKNQTTQGKTMRIQIKFDKTRIS